MESMAIYSSSSTTTATSFSRFSLPRPPPLRPSPPPSNLPPKLPFIHTPHPFPPFSTPFTKPFPEDSPSSPAPPPPPPNRHPASPPLQGAKLIPLIISVAIGVVVRFFVPKPPEVTPQAWQLLSIFLSTSPASSSAPYPSALGPSSASPPQFSPKHSPSPPPSPPSLMRSFGSLSSPSSSPAAFVKTGLGDRIATYFVKWLGKSTLGLSYGLTLSEALIAPAMPSTTARAGGVFLPIIKSLSLSAGSNPGDPSKKKLGSYLVQSQLQSAGNSSGLFLTAAAQNLLCLKLAEELGVVISSPWVSWFKAASLPAFISLLATPFILYKLYPPEIKDTPDAPAMAAKRLELMGPVTKNELVMIGTMLLAVSLWIFGDALGIASVVAAMLGLSILLLLGVLDWNDCLSEKSAWDTLAWFAVLVGMAGQLTNLGIVSWMSTCVAKALQSLSLSWPAAFGVLQAAYFLYPLLICKSNWPCRSAVLCISCHAFGIRSSRRSSSTGSSLQYQSIWCFDTLQQWSSCCLFRRYSYSSLSRVLRPGYVDLPDVFKYGFIMALVNAVIWGVVGGFWWKFLGLY
ncbi:hypothetical protein SASPL_115465 [Salvia splendens]|uniref:Divalent anion:Na+ symporter, DASS family n=1 Tax=Salvia splendens TaxID=180675 RepID=A0A8X9A0B4_SALSN|nr:hypothetical protein SASPL_115465 [Salvia splendens]